MWKSIAVVVLAVVAFKFINLRQLWKPEDADAIAVGTAAHSALLTNLAQAHKAQQPWFTMQSKPPGALMAIAAARSNVTVPKIHLKVCKLKICDKFPAVVEPKCASCLVIFSLPTWAHDMQGKPNPPLARLPVYEAGFTSLATIPLLYPRRWVSFDLRNPGLTDYAAMADAQTLSNENWRGGVNPRTATWTIDGITRPCVSHMRYNVPPACVEVLGWITPEGTPPCPGAPPLHDVNVHFPSLKAAGGEALPLAYGNSEQYRGVSLSLTADAFSSARGAARAVLDSLQHSYATTLYLRNVTSPERLAALAAMYGDEWAALGAEKIADAGDLVEIDLTYTQGFQSTTPGGPWWNVAAHALFRVEDARVGVDGEARTAGHVEPSFSLAPVAIRLSNQPEDPEAVVVYTPAKSESAYVAAATALRQAVTQTAIWVGHVYNLHIHSVAVTAALYNTIDKDANVYHSSHPVRQVLDFFGDPTYVSEFHASLFAGGYDAGPGVAAGVPDLLSLWQAYASYGIMSGDTSWAGSTVEAQLKASGLSEERFRGDGPPGAWHGLPGAAFHLALRRDVVRPYTTALAEAAYPSDDAVAGDKELQLFATALVAPLGANLGRINDEGSKLRTRAQLAKFLEDFVTVVLAHGTAHLQDFSIRILNVALMPPRLGNQSAPCPTAKYSEADQLRWVPTTGTAARQYVFVANFVGTTVLPITNLVTSQQSIKGSPASWEDGHPYFTGLKADVMKVAHEAFIRKASNFLNDWPRSNGLRAVATNFQSPTRLPRVINI